MENVILTIILATAFLGGCNWGNNAVEDHPVREVENDVRRGVDDVEDALDPNNRDDAYDRNNVNGNGVDRGTVNDNTTLPEATTPVQMPISTAQTAMITHQMQTV